MFKQKIKLFLFAATLGIFSLSAQQQQQDVSDTELAQFADAYIGLQLENQKIEQEMVSIIEKEGLELQRFNQIQETSMNPDKENSASESEMKKHAQAISEIQKLQPELEKRAIQGIEKTGISFEKYQSLATAIQADQKLQQKLQTILMERQKM